MLAAALEAHDAGLCVVPPAQDGSKRPLSEWKRYQTERPPREQSEAWYRDPGREGIGYVCGRVSGGLELFEFDDERAFCAFEQLVENHGLSDRWHRLTSGYLEATPSGGRHVLWYTDVQEGNQQLARRPSVDDEGNRKVAVLIETRGEGGYVVAAPSGGGVHPTGGSYQLISGGPASIQTISAEERETFFALARMLDEMPSKSKEPPAVRRSSGDRPGDRFNRETRWEDLLPKYGWTVDKQIGEETYWTRPGKGWGVSATTNYNGSGVLKVFTPSTSLEAGATYSPFAFYAAMEHEGDFSAAASALVNRYGAEVKDAERSQGRRASDPPDRRLICRKLSEVEPRPIDWLWQGRLARGKFHLLGGMAGDGKSTIAANLAAIGSVGGRWPDHSRAPQLRTLFILGEDAVDDTLLPRIDLHGGNLEHITALEGVHDGEGRERHFNVERHLDLLERTVNEEQIDVIIIDPLTTIMAGKNRNDEGDVRDSLTALTKMAERRNVAIMGIVHVGKSNGMGRTSAQRILGATAFVAMARIVWQTATVDGDLKAMGVTKSNLSKVPTTLLWSRAEDAPIAWEGTSDRSIDDLMEKSGRRLPRNAAKEFLNAFLASGMQPTTVVQDEAKKLGITQRTLRRAADDLGVKSVRLPSGTGPWYWTLPNSQAVVNDGQGQESPGRIPHEGDDQMATALYMPRWPSGHLARPNP